MFDTIDHAGYRLIILGDFNDSVSRKDTGRWQCNRFFLERTSEIIMALAQLTFVKEIASYQFFSSREMLK